MNGYGKALPPPASLFFGFSHSFTFTKAGMAYPLLPYLKFDFAEVPVMIALMLGGLVPGLVTEVIHWMSLSLARRWVLGPSYSSHDTR